MSIVVRFHPTNATKEKYDESMRRMEAAGIWPNPPGLEVHVAFGPDDDLRASEIWSSREEFEAYGEKLMPILCCRSEVRPARPYLSSLVRLAATAPTNIPRNRPNRVLSGEARRGHAGRDTGDHS